MLSLLQHLFPPPAPRPPPSPDTLAAAASLLHAAEEALALRVICAAPTQAAAALVLVEQAERTLRADHPQSVLQRWLGAVVEPHLGQPLLVAHCAMLRVRPEPEPCPSVGLRAHPHARTSPLALTLFPPSVYGRGCRACCWRCRRTTTVLHMRFIHHYDT
jgi:hypothetical protein